jgi:adenylate cyclase
MFTERLLSGYEGLELRHARSVDEGIGVAEELQPTVVVRTVGLGDPEELESLTLLRQSPSTRDVPLLVLLHAPDERLERIVLDRGADGCVSRSADPEALVAAIRDGSRRFAASLRRRVTRTATDEKDEPPRVFMVDDSRMVCLSVEQRLSDQLVVFEHCTDPTQALERVRAFSPTVILLDLEMPGLSGFEVLEMLRADPVTADVPVVVLSAISDAEVKARTFLAGANDYAEKQMDRVELRSRIEYHSRAFRNARHLDHAIGDLIEARRRLELQRNFIRKTFGRYLSDEVVESILERPEGLELGGEKRVITIMMADLRGFTSLSERLAPEQVLALINNFLSVMTDIIMAHKGTIDEFLGDAILAMFGAPIQRPDDAQRAVACALEMQLAMDGVNEWSRARGYPAVAMGVGLATGEVVVGNIGSERRSKYGIIGRYVNLTARIESYTVGGQILISRSTRDACGPTLRIDGESEVMPKGVKEPITIYEVGGIGEPFNTFLPVKERVELRAVSPPVALRIGRLSGKHADAASHDGTLVGIAGNLVEVDAEAEVESLENLKLVVLDRRSQVVTDELYAKVVEVQTSGHSAQRLRLNLTSIPPAAEAFFAALVLGQVEEQA